VYLLRVGRQHRWSFERDASDSEDVAEASRDLKLDMDEEGLSVYRVEGEGETLEVAVRWALTCRPKPRPMDYLPARQLRLGQERPRLRSRQGPGDWVYYRAGAGLAAAIPSTRGPGPLVMRRLKG
jgi:hypothetical protein